MRPRNEIGSRPSSLSAPLLLAAPHPVAYAADGRHPRHLHTPARHRRMGCPRARANSRKLLAPIRAPGDLALRGAFSRRIGEYVRPESKQTWIRTGTAISRIATHRFVRLSALNLNILPHRHPPKRDHHHAETRSRRIFHLHNLHERVCLAPLFAAATMRKTRR